MEERLPLSDDTKTKLPPPPGAASLNTYVVQIPRDQIYRVPPPENARIIEDHIRNSSNQEAKRRSSTRTYALAIFVFIVIMVATVLTIRATLYRPKTPRFAVREIHGENLDNRHAPEFKITVEAKNPNTRMSVSYQGGGEATLIFKDKKIGHGKTPTTIDGGAATDFAVVLAAPLSKEVKKSLNDDREKAMQLKIDLPMEMKSWVRNERMNVKISCDFRVRNSLMNNTKISFQECVTEF